jgi:hypothetical protein
LFLSIDFGFLHLQNKAVEDENFQGLPIPRYPLLILTFHRFYEGSSPLLATFAGNNLVKMLA